MNVTLIISRFDPDRDQAPHEQVFRLQAEADVRVLDLLEWVRDRQDPTLAFRSCCSQGACGSDAMRINGRNRLACRTRVNDLKTREIRITPLPGFRVIRDLLVDLEPFLDRYREVLGALAEDEQDRLPGETTVVKTEVCIPFNQLGSCIFCAVCTSACPVFRIQPGYLGPAALVQAWPALLFGGNGGQAGLARVVDRVEGAWGCRTAAACSESCPQGIPLTRLLTEIKQSL
jgi:succinate dehydrogenase / fumarate reductase, iron-sulfur subunit